MVVLLAGVGELLLPAPPASVLRGTRVWEPRGRRQPGLAEENHGRAGQRLPQHQERPAPVCEGQPANTHPP